MAGVRTQNCKRMPAESEDGWGSDPKPRTDAGRVRRWLGFGHKTADGCRQSPKMAGVRTQNRERMPAESEDGWGSDTKPRTDAGRVRRWLGFGHKTANGCRLSPKMAGVRTQNRERMPAESEDGWSSDTKLETDAGRVRSWLEFGPKTGNGCRQSPKMAGVRTQNRERMPAESEVGWGSDPKPRTDAR
ncbi:MAG: hypothetical protein ACQEXE_06515 [Bacillota bacterium]